MERSLEGMNLKGCLEVQSTEEDGKYFERVKDEYWKYWSRMEGSIEGSLKRSQKYRGKDAWKLTGMHRITTGGMKVWKEVWKERWMIWKEEWNFNKSNGNMEVEWKEVYKESWMEVRKFVRKEVQQEGWKYGRKYRMNLKELWK